MMPKTITAFNSASESQRFSTAVAGFGQLLRQSTNMGQLSYGQVAQMAQQAKGMDNTGAKAEFIQLVKNAQALAGQVQAE
jgi:Ca-activated chloride channel family protein